MPGVGHGYNLNDLNGDVGALAILAMKTVAEASDLRKWLDRISADANPAVVATALQTKLGGSAVVSDTDARKLVDAIQEITYWTSTFVPTHTLDVRGPSSFL